jgi:hypothetical protein
VVIDLILAIKEIILLHELLNKKYYSLLLNYLTTLTSINSSRLDSLWPSINDLFLKLVESEKELDIHFGIDYLIFITNFCFGKIIENSSDLETMNNKNLEKCIFLVNSLIHKNSGSINSEVLRVIESIVDTNGYEIPPKHWNLLLEKIKQMMDYYAQNQISEEVSKFSQLISIRDDSEDHCSLSFVF